MFRDRFGTKILSSDPRPKCKVLIFMATKKREKDTSNPPPATKGSDFSIRPLFLCLGLDVVD
nr:MAG TPA: hypothetical protein [Caudoviricetes sp.]